MQPAEARGTSDAPPESWVAELDVELAERAAQTRVSRVRHRGPLRIQRPFHPESDGTAHLYLLHPPGGVVGGDHLRLSVTLKSAAHGLVTTPAATKLYRSGGSLSVVRQQLFVAAGCLLEWLPQETIAFDGAFADLSTIVSLEKDGQFIGWEILCAGRPAADERYVRGSLTQRLEVWQDGRPLYADRLRLAGGGTAIAAKWGLGGEPVVATMLLAGTEHRLATRLRTVLPTSTSAPAEAPLSDDAEACCGWSERDSTVPRFAASDLEGLTVLRYVGPSVQGCWQTFVAAWQLARPYFSGTAAISPRIWNL